MLPEFRGNLRGKPRKRPDIKYMHIFLVKLSVEGICTVYVATGNPRNDTTNH